MEPFFPDLMVDTETTGNDNPEIFGCFQIAAIQFNAKTGEIGPVFDRVPELLPNRHWTGDTKEFWMVKNRAVYNSIIARSEPAPRVWSDFRDFALQGAPNGGRRFWAKPVTFDWPVVASHMRQLGLPMPFHYRLARDLNSYMAALRDNPDHPNVEADVANGGDQHNALHDAAYQIDLLMHEQRKHIHASVQ